MIAGRSQTASIGHNCQASGECAAIGCRVCSLVREGSATLWLVIPGSAPIPLQVGGVFDPALLDRPPGQTERLLRHARETAARKASRAAGAGGRQRGQDSDLQTEWEAATAPGSALGRAWSLPAHKRGVTQAQAAEMYGRPAVEVQRAFRMGGAQQAAVGQRDAWDVWFAERADLEAAFGSEATARRAASGQSAAVGQAADRINRRQDNQRGQG